MFQSSCTSWSSKIIAVGTVDSSQRTDGSVQGDPVLIVGARPQAVEHQERVVMPVHLKSSRLVTEDFDLAGPVGLDPDRGLGLGHVPQQGPENQIGRGA